jgi:xanthine/CO dehydrogenase XdhC/CoxF family maturation factor
MTKEISDIIAAFKEARQHGRQTALATVVHVEGSSYRRPGARMLIESDGKITGAISGGCLEGDALRKALHAMSQGENKLVTYNTLDKDDVEFGVQLGCNGIVHILFEPIYPQQADNPVALLENCISERKNTVIVTLFSLQKYQGPQPGTCLFFDGEGIHGTPGDVKLAGEMQNDAITALSTQRSLLKQYNNNQLTAFIEFIEPPVSLVIIGAGNDVLPLVDIVTLLGWQTTVIDGRSTHANSQRFSKADKVIVGKPSDVIQQVGVDERTVFVLMTHNYNYDLAMLGILLQKKCAYIGALGPKTRLHRMLEELHEQGLIVTDEQKAMIYGPAGLDIGAETAEEIALSIIAEIKAVLSRRPGDFLKARLQAIHPRTAEGTSITYLND